MIVRSDLRTEVSVCCRCCLTLFCALWGRTPRTKQRFRLEYQASRSVACNVRSRWPEADCASLHFPIMRTPRVPPVDFDERLFYLVRRIFHPRASEIKMGGDRPLESWPLDDRGWLLSPKQIPFDWRLHRTNLSSETKSNNSFPFHSEPGLCRFAQRRVRRT